MHESPDFNPAPEDVEVAFTLKADPNPVIGQYVLGFEGEATAWDETAGDDRMVGRIRGQRIDLISAIQDGIPRDLLLDSLTPEIADFSATVLGEGPCLLLQGVVTGLPEEECDCIAYVAELWIEPEHRGCGLGTTLLRRLAASIDLTRCLVALKALPLREDHAHVPTDEEIARVKRFYARNGFNHSEGEYMVKDARLCEAIKKRLSGRRGG
jgi:GNAT superfamily N-acetyltransferase